MLHQNLPLLLLLALLGACDLDGDDLIYPGASVYQAPDQGFHFHYLSPPWRHETKDAKHLAYLVVDDTNQYDHSGEITVSHKLFVGYHSQSPERAAKSLHAGSLKEGMTISHDIAPFTTRTGEEGVQYQAYKEQEGERFFYRYSLLPDEYGKTVLFHLIAAYPTDEQEIDDLILSYSAGPDDGTPTPKWRGDAGRSSSDGGTQ